MGLEPELFEGTIDDDLICGMCHKVLLDPVTNCCPHIFCNSCISKRLKQPEHTRACPVCSQRLDPNPGQPSVDFKLRLLELPMRCSHKCGYVCALVELPDHVAEMCPNAPVLCHNVKKGCRKKVRRRDFERHLQECDYREVICEACGLTTIYCELYTHQSRVKCLEKKLKQQVILAGRSTSQQVRKHMSTLQREHIRLDQQQRRRIVNHVKMLGAPSPRASPRSSLSLNQDHTFTNGNIFITQDVTESAQQVSATKGSHGRAPHPSRSGHSVLSCSKCKKTFKFDTNHENACRHHEGPILQVFGGTCYACGRLDYQPGCMTGFHKVEA